MNSGHYWSYINTTCKPGQESKWIKCDDSHVTPVESREAIQQQFGPPPTSFDGVAYCLIYIQNDLVSNMFSSKVIFQII